jgi:hypothetical protein
LPVEILSTLERVRDRYGGPPVTTPNDRKHRETPMADHLDVPLEDATLMEEVELISTLMIAASETEGQLEQNQIDRLLGVPDDEATRGPSRSALPQQSSRGASR